MAEWKTHPCPGGQVCESVLETHVRGHGCISSISTISLLASSVLIAGGLTEAYTGVADPVGY